MRSRSNDAYSAYSALRPYARLMIRIDELRHEDTLSEGNWRIPACRKPACVHAQRIRANTRETMHARTREQVPCTLWLIFLAQNRVKNKQPAPVQITAEQILREAKERQEEDPKPPKQKITDPDELAEYRTRKRKEFEDGIRRNRNAIPLWIKYAMWEETQLEFDRARSVWERSLEIGDVH